MTALELVQDNPVVSVTGKTAADYRDDLQTLIAEQRLVKELVADLTSRTERWHRMIANRTTGRCTDGELLAAERAMEEAQKAAPRLIALDRSIVDVQSSIRFMESQERGAVCEGISGEFDAVYETYKEQSRAVLDTFRQLQMINQKYAAMTGRHMLESFHRELNLPALTGMLSARSGFSTGSE